MAGFCPKPCPVRSQRTAIRRQILFRKNQKPKQWKPQNTSHPAHGGNRFRSRELVQRSISTKEMALLKQRQTNYTAVAARMASIGASRLNQMAKESAP